MKAKKGDGSASGEDMDVIYYNHLLDVLRQQQEAGVSYYGSFVNKSKPVPPEQLTAYQETLARRRNPSSPGFGWPIGAGQAPPGLRKQPDDQVVLQDFPAGRKALRVIESAKVRYGAPWQSRLKTDLEANATASPKEKSGPFSEDDDVLVLVARYLNGSKWLDVSKCIPGRGVLAVKKHWHSTLKQKFNRAGWCARLLSPPEEMDDDPARAVERSLYGKIAPDGLSEREEKLIAREAAEIALAMSSGDREGEHRCYHMQYIRVMRHAEDLGVTPNDWDDCCFVCKDGRELVLCGHGHDGIGGQDAKRNPCWKSYHMACLSPDMAPKEDDDSWVCPRHKCIIQGCGNTPRLFCRSCPKSFCGSHKPDQWRSIRMVPEISPSGEGTIVRNIGSCRSCQEIEAKAPAFLKESPLPRPSPIAPAMPVQHVQITQALQPPPPQQAAAAAAATQVAVQSQEVQHPMVAAQRGVAVALAVPRGEAVAKPADSGGMSDSGETDDGAIKDSEEDWVKLLSSIKSMPTNNGGPILDRIKQATMMAAQNGHLYPEIREKLEAAMNPHVYKSNSAGHTKNLALEALNLYRMKMGRISSMPAFSRKRKDHPPPLSPLGHS